MVSTNIQLLVNFDFFFSRSGTDRSSYKKHIIIPDGNAWHIFFMACRKLEAMAIYVNSVSKRKAQNYIQECH